ncbi:MAG: hypothetical protein ACK4TC_04795 [Sphingomonas pseudosanguinis]|uniref:hypothetical protein n=1 Tax=Sphingomonas pseudosanguinis TaxID=413712 RepID=UPI00391A8D81
MATVDGHEIISSGVMILPSDTTRVTFPTGVGSIGLQTSNSGSNSDAEFQHAGWWTGFELNPDMTTMGSASHGPGDRSTLEIDWIVDPITFRDNLKYRFTYSVRRVI